MLSPRRRNLAAFVAAGALVVAGCGGDDGGATPAPATTAPTPSDAAPEADDGPPEDDTPSDAASPDDDATDGETGSGEAGSGESSSGDDIAETPPATAPEILQISAPLIGGGGDLDLATFGDRPVLLWFWSPF